MWRLYPIYVLKFGVQLTILFDWLLDDLVKLFTLIWVVCYIANKSTFVFPQ